MTKCLLFVVAALSTYAHAAQYYCVTSSEVPNKFYEYADDYSSVTLYEMTGGKDAKDFVVHHPKEYGFKEPAVKHLADYDFATNNPRKVLSVFHQGQVLLQVTEPKGELTYKPEESRENRGGSLVIFDGKIVKSVEFVWCGKD